MNIEDSQKSPMHWLLRSKSLSTRTTNPAISKCHMNEIAKGGVRVKKEQIESVTSHHTKKLTHDGLYSHQVAILCEVPLIQTGEACWPTCRKLHNHVEFCIEGWGIGILCGKWAGSQSFTKWQLEQRLLGLIATKKCRLWGLIRADVHCWRIDVTFRYFEQSHVLKWKE